MFVNRPLERFQDAASGKQGKFQLSSLVLNLGLPAHSGLLEVASRPWIRAVRVEDGDGLHKLQQDMSPIVQAGPKRKRRFKGLQVSALKYCVIA